MKGKLIQHRDTSPPESMPALNHVWRRNGVFYFRMAIPRELRRAGVSFDVEGKKMRLEIKFSLRVSDYRSAASKVALHAAIWREKFDARLAVLARAKEARELKGFATGCNAPTANGSAVMVTDERIRAILIREFVQMQKDTAKAVEALNGSDKGEKTEVLADLGMEMRGYENDREGESGLVGMLQTCLASYGLESLPITSTAFQSLLFGYRAALLEDLRRRAHWIADGTPAEFDPMFKGIHAGSTPPDAKAKMTLADLRAAFEKAHIAKGSAPSTQRAYSQAFRVLNEYFDASIQVESIDRLKMTAFFDFLDTVPRQAEQRYKGKTLKQAASLEAKSKEPRFMVSRTKSNYHGRIVAIFEYAKELEIIEKNPASTKTLHARFPFEKKSSRPPMTVEEINAIFRAPLFTGCIDDGKGWSKPGPNHPRRGRFWVPLLALFNGLRCNEACQLEVSDVLTVEGVSCIRVTDESDDKEGAGKGKRTKKGGSKSTIPMHPRLIEMGFLEFVKSRSVAGDGIQLFPELPRNRDGQYSNIFSKWFRRFFTMAMEGKKTKASFHSSRHSFRDATRRAGLHVEVADKLGRWITPGSVGRNYGEGFPLATLRDELAKVDYPGVDLSHLMPKPQRIRTPASIAPGYPKA